MSTRKIVTNTLYYGIVPKLTMLLSVILLPITSPFLSPYDYGIYGVIVSYANLFNSIAPLGLHVHLTNSYFEYPKNFNLVWGRVLQLMLLSSLCFGIINMGILLYTLPMEDSWHKILLCIIGTVPIFLLANGILAQHLFPLRETPQPLVFTNLVGSVMGMLASFVMVYYLRLGFWGLTSANTIASLFTFTVFIKFVWWDYDIRPILDHNLKRIKEMLRIAFPLIPHAMGFVLLTSSARIVMSQYHLPYDDIGLFNHGSTMGDYGVVITSALVTAIVPQMQKLYRSGDYGSYRKLYILCQAVALTTTFLICLWMPEIYRLLIRNVELAQSCNIASLLCFANVVFSFYVFMSTPVFIEKNTIQLLWLVFVPGTLNFILCLLLIPFWGYRVAIYSTIISYWSQLLIPFFVKFYRSNVKRWLGDRRFILLILLVIIADLIVANVLMYSSLWLKVILSFLIGSVFYYFYRHFRFSELL